jgi:putative spermidine/putrescine transport system ATP-binding protein
VPIEKRNVGMVFQSYALFPNMNVADNIGYGLKIRGVGEGERKARIAELVALTGIEGLEHRRIDQLSGGQRQRASRLRVRSRHGRACFSSTSPSPRWTRRCANGCAAN